MTSDKGQVTNDKGKVTMLEYCDSVWQGSKGHPRTEMASCRSDPRRTPAPAPAPACAPRSRSGPGPAPKSYSHDLRRVSERFYTRGAREGVVVRRVFVVRDLQGGCWKIQRRGATRSAWLY